MFGHTSGVISLAVLQDGITLVCGSMDKTIKLWNTQDGSLIRTLTGRKVMSYYLHYFQQ